jgi:hypothetical protein
MTSEAKTLYASLAAPFDGYYTAVGVFGPFLSGEQVTGRLNDVLGVGNWAFSVVQYSYDERTDEVVALGELRAYIDDQWVTRQQFGGQKLNRKKDGEVVSLGNDHKGAATDAMKKCASLLGVGLYLMVSAATWHQGTPERIEQAATARSGRSRQDSRPNTPARSAVAPEAAQSDSEPPALPASRQVARTGPSYRCMECQKPLEEVTIPARDGKPATKWTIAKLRYQSLRRHGTVLCRDCWRKAEELARGQVAS